MASNMPIRRLVGRATSFSALVLLAGASGGCNNAAEGTLSGAALGAGAGAVIGSFFGAAGTGAAVGAVGGALGGGVIGDQNDRQARRHHGGHTWADYRCRDW
ncbi:MAG: hypothetical protein KF699_01165 [Phycisphaeraceae bacterium]|nr:hypothetical protein [Phycisphaeraceae bacterium]MBX3406037.1 hypothetical protein [Phycisphaeraceae bacterium]